MPHKKPRQDPMEDPFVTDEALRRIGAGGKGNQLADTLAFLQGALERRGVARDDASRVQSLVALPTQGETRFQDQGNPAASLIDELIQALAFGPNFDDSTDQNRDVAKGLAALLGKGPTDRTGFSAAVDRRNRR